MRKVKVLQFTIGNIYGGVTQYVMENWKFIDKDKFQFDFATMSKKLDFEKELVAEGCKVHYISCYAEENKEQFIRELEKIFENRYDIVHLHTNFWRSFIVEDIAKKCGVPKIIVHSHNSMIDIVDEKKRNEAIKIHNRQRKIFSLDNATDFWACSELASNWLFDDRIPKDKIKIMKNAIDVDRFSYNVSVREEYRKKLGLEKCFVLGHVGRFVYQKNHDLLINVFKKACKNIPNLRLMLIGTGNLEKEIHEKVKAYGLDDKVLFMGKRKDVHCLMQAMDLFLLPSRFEGLPIVLIEAQASGLKCLVSDAIPKEVKITNNIKFLTLCINEWVNEICYYSKGYIRKKTDNDITNAGYNIIKQIKVLEDLYLKGINL